MTVGVVGLGLIGGSVGLALREPGRTILGCDAAPTNERLAAERFCVDRIAPLEEVAKADVVFIAVPPAAISATLDAIAPLRGEETIVTDCASV
ncbi:prephenate dehydrogenase/arogenate dehydrogenase family protein, partial [bacterium]